MKAQLEKVTMAYNSLLLNQVSRREGSATSTRTIGGSSPNIKYSPSSTPGKGVSITTTTFQEGGKQSKLPPPTFTPYPTLQVKGEVSEWIERILEHAGECLRVQAINEMAAREAGVGVNPFMQWMRDQLKARDTFPSLLRDKLDTLIMAEDKPTEWYHLWDFLLDLQHPKTKTRVLQLASSLGGQGGECTKVMESGGHYPDFCWVH